MKQLLVAAALAAAATGVFAGATITDAQVDAAFAKADPDKDGTLDMKEARKFGIDAALFKKVNPDNDDTLDLGEYLDALIAQIK